MLVQVSAAYKDQQFVKRLAECGRDIGGVLLYLASGHRNTILFECHMGDHLDLL